MATGSWAMPSNEPAPSSGTDEQAGPNGASAGAALAELPMPSSATGADADDFPEEPDEAESLPLSEQALRDRGRTTAAVTASAARRIRVFMVCLLLVDAAGAAFTSGVGKVV
ncbi:hypothetical protein GCM10022295_12860 [Streptomyces osmaniensis]|uniref:Uncharacterized protein n=1 Tax=Streptomyces osmaniensis TaxID=593134 RepID=A0ABP6VEZ9_9ACTN